MIPLNFYRDDEYVYYNNPNGITKKITIADFESLMSGDSSGGNDIMVIQRDTDLNKNFNDIHSAMSAGKSCVIITLDAGGDVVFHEYVTACYDYGEDYLEAGADHRCYVDSITTVNGEVYINRYYADTTTDNLAILGDAPIT